MHILEEWRIRDVERKADQAVSRFYELDSLRSDMARMERANEESRTFIAGLRDAVETCLHQIAFLENEIRRLTENSNP